MRVYVEITPDDIKITDNIGLVWYVSGDHLKDEPRLVPILARALYDAGAGVAAGSIRERIGEQLAQLRAHKQQEEK